MEELKTLEYKAKLQPDERLYIKGLKYKRALREEQLRKLKFKSFDGTYREFLKAQTVLNNAIQELNISIKSFLNLLITGDKERINE